MGVHLKGLGKKHDLTSIHNIHFYGELEKIIQELSLKNFSVQSKTSCSCSIIRGMSKVMGLRDCSNFSFISLVS